MGRFRPSSSRKTSRTLRRTEGVSRRIRPNNPHRSVINPTPRPVKSWCKAWSILHPGRTTPVWRLSSRMPAIMERQPSTEPRALLTRLLELGTLGLGARIESAVRNIVKAGAEVTSEALGGVYRLIDSETGEVMRTGRTNDLIRRGAEHGRDPVLKAYSFETVFRTDDYAELRGLEQYLHELHSPPLNRKNPIDPRNENRDQHIEAAKRYLERILGK